jgi:peptidoglycan DL-endopeptidase LytE
VIAGRYITHGVVFALALALSGYATLDHGLPQALRLRLGETNAQGLVMGQGGQVGTVQLGRLSTIIKPIGIPTSAPVSHTAITYEVKNGESLKDLAAQFHVSTNSIRWSNFSALKNTSKDVSAGQKLMIPPVDGIVVTAQPGDTPLSLGNTYHVSPSAIVDFNYLRSSEQDPIAGGTVVVIPGGTGASFETPASSSSVAVPVAHGGNGGYSILTVGGSYPVRAGNRFSFGYCTWYVYNRRAVPWLGNAWQWFGNAQAAGFATGQTPRVGAIMVTWESSFGHVAIVDAVNPDGSFVVSEMNFVRWDVIDQRQIKPGGVPLIGFIY